MSANNKISQESTWIFGVWSLTLIREDYIALYVDTVKTVAVREDPSRFFVVSRFLSFKPQFFKLNFIISSPSNGVASEEAGYIADNPQSSLWGDTHHYDYKWNDYKSKQSSIPCCFDLRSNNWEWQNYPQTRFASEYGFQAFPAFSVLEPVDSITVSIFTDIVIELTARSK